MNETKSGLKLDAVRLNEEQASALQERYSLNGDNDIYGSFSLSVVPIDGNVYLDITASSPIGYVMLNAFVRGWTACDRKWMDVAEKAMEVR